MKEKMLNDFNNEKNIVINIKQNEYAIFDKKKFSKSIIRFFTDAIVTCSLFLISINMMTLYFLAILTNTQILWKQLK